MLALKRRENGADEEHVDSDYNESRGLEEVLPSDSIGHLPKRTKKSNTKDISRAKDYREFSPCKPNETQSLTLQSNIQDPVTDSKCSVRRSISWPNTPTGSLCNGSQETNPQPAQPSSNPTRSLPPKEVVSTYRKSDESQRKVLEGAKSHPGLLISSIPARTHSGSLNGSVLFPSTTGTLRPFRRRKPQPWPDPQQSLGQMIKTTKKKIKGKVWAAEGPALELYKEQIRPQIEKLLHNIEPPQCAPLLLTLYMIGKGEATASPIIMITCRDRKVRKDSEAIIRGSDILQQFPQMGLGNSVTGLETDSIPVPVTGSVSTSHMDVDGSSRIEICSPQEPIIGRRMRFVERAEGGKTVRFATGGAFVRIKENIYQLTAFHIGQTVVGHGSVAQLELNADGCDCNGQFHADVVSDLEAAQLDSDPEDCEYDGQSETEEDESDFGWNDTKSSPLKEEGSTKLDVELQSMPGFKADHGNETILEKIGQQNAWNPQTSLNRSKVDYLLVRLPAGEASKASNTIGHPQDHHSIQITDIGAPPASPTEVIVVTSSNGYYLLTGTILPGTKRVKMHGFHGFQDVLIARLSSSVKLGDSGSAVLDARTGRLYGHVVLGSAPDTVVHIVPSAEIFTNIHALFGTRPSLNLTARASYERNPSEPHGEQHGVSTTDGLDPRTESQLSLEKPAPKLEPEESNIEAVGSEENKVPLRTGCRVGKVFQVPWSEPTLSEDQPDATPSKAYLDQIPTGYRRFILIRKEEHHTTCIPILNYGQSGCAGGQLRPHTHGIIYDNGSQPGRLSGEPELGFASIRFDPSSRHCMGQDARVDYSKLVHVMYDVEVTFIGMIAPEYWMKVTNAVGRCWHIQEGYHERAILLRANAAPRTSHFVYRGSAPRQRKGEPNLYYPTSVFRSIPETGEVSYFNDEQRTGSMWSTAAPHTNRTEKVVVRRGA